MKNLLLTLAILSIAVFEGNAQHVISGKVTGSDGEGLIGVNILEKGTRSGTVSDFDGSYALTVKSTDAIVVYSYTGYSTYELKLEGQAEVNVTLQEGIDLGTVQVVGSRVKRSSVDSPVAIDVIDVAELSSNTGKAEINQILQYAAPSFNATKQSGSDGADHIDPASLRGLGPDQTLVLVNGKRRHQSSLVNVFGTRGRGNSGTDLNAIPASAIKRIEVLRDGASAQYGSDAIAGVINIVLKDKTDGVTGGISYGANSTAVGEEWEKEAGETIWNVEGKNRLYDEDKSFDGNTLKVDLNYGVDLGDKGGYANFTTEYLTKERTLRPGWSWRKGYGSAAIDGFNFMVNSAMPLGEKTELYAFGGRNYRDTDAYAFSRDGFADGDNRAVPSLHPDGFTPRITSIIKDLSGSVGIRHSMDNGWKVDFNNTYGKNKFHYFIKNSNNASMGDASPTDFDAGGHSLTQNTTGLDFSKYYKDIAAGFNLAFGAEFRAENFDIFAGEVASYATYDTNGIPITDPSTQTVAVDANGDDLPGGSQGFPGYSPGNVIDRNRSNIGFYVDGEINVIEDLLFGAALRLENYSDFGETFNYKVSGRYELVDGLAVRGSVSSGFRAPSLAQVYYNLIFNNIVAGKSVPSLLAGNNSTIARAFGIPALTEETALNGSAGITYKKGGFTATIDGYLINVDDRIVLTDNFDPVESGVNVDLGVETAQFFVNGIDTETKGVDLVLSYKHFFGDKNLTVGLAGNINDTKVKSINNPENLNVYRFFGPFSQAYLEAAAPDYKFGLNLGFATPKFNALVSLTQFSEVIIQDFQWVDEMPTDPVRVGELLEEAKDTYAAAMTLDISLSYDVTKNFTLTIGGNNILNQYPTAQPDGWTDQGGFADSVQMGSDGAYFFGRVGFKF